MAGELVTRGGARTCVESEPAPWEHGAQRVQRVQRVRSLSVTDDVICEDKVEKKTEEETEEEEEAPSEVCDERRFVSFLFSEDLVELCESGDNYARVVTTMRE